MAGWQVYTGGIRSDPEAAPVEEVLTAEEVAGYLRVHLMTVRRWCREGMLPAVKVGRAYRIKRTELDQWWQERRQRGDVRNGGPTPQARRTREHPEHE